MKKRKIKWALFAAILMIGLVSCEDNAKTENRDYGILPERFKVDVPASISAELKSTNTKSANEEISGNSIYVHLTNFISIGEGAADIVEELMWNIAIHKIDQITTLEYVCEEDNRTKILTVESDITYENTVWDYQLTITDKAIEEETNDGIGMQVFWNTGTIEGIALFKPSNINVNGKGEIADAMIRIKYSEVKLQDYEAHMIVDIIDIPIDIQDEFAVDNLKMFVGKKGGIVDVYGNSNHPQATMFGSGTGVNWAFVAAGFTNKDLGVAEVGLPPSNLDGSLRKVLLEDYSIRNTFLEYLLNIPEYQTFYASQGVETISDLEMLVYNPLLDGNADILILRSFLNDAKAPGYFDANGFVSAGMNSNNEYLPLEESILNLAPFNPREITELNISFN